MPTIQQLVRKGRLTPTFNSKAPALDACPQRRGVCVRVYNAIHKRLQSCLKDKKVIDGDRMRREERDHFVLIK